MMIPGRGRRSGGESTDAKSRERTQLPEWQATDQGDRSARKGSESPLEIARTNPTARMAGIGRGCWGRNATNEPNRPDFRSTSGFCDGPWRGKTTNEPNRGGPSSRRGDGIGPRGGEDGPAHGQRAADPTGLDRTGPDCPATRPWPLAPPRDASTMAVIAPVRKEIGFPARRGRADRQSRPSDFGSPGPALRGVRAARYNSRIDRGGRPVDRPAPTRWGGAATRLRRMERNRTKLAGWRL